LPALPPRQLFGLPPAVDPPEGPCELAFDARRGHRRLGNFTPRAPERWWTHAV